MKPLLARFTRSGFRLAPALCLAGLAAPLSAAAQEAAPAAAQPASVEAKADGKAKPQKSADKVVCKRFETTGSYLSHTRVCRKAPDRKKSGDGTPRTASDN